MSYITSKCDLFLKGVLPTNNSNVNIPTAQLSIFKS